MKEKRISPSEYMMRMFSGAELDEILELQEESDFVNKVKEHNEEKRRAKKSKK